MNLISILLLTISLLSKFSPLKSSTSVPQGTHVVSASLIDKNGKITHFIINDSLMFYGHWVAEVKVRVELVEIFGVPQPRKDIFDGFYLINLQRKSFAELKDLKNLKGLTYKPLSEKKTGFDFYGGAGLFHNEPFRIENAVYQQKKARKISYTMNGGPYHHRQVTIFVGEVSDSNHPLLYPKMEKAFKGPIQEIRIDLKEQGIAVLHFSFSPKIKKEYLDQLRLLQDI